LNTPLPVCDAMIVHVPAATSVALEPDTVQTPVVDEVYETAKPELAVALRVSPLPTVCAGIAAKVIVWEKNGIAGSESVIASTVTFRSAGRVKLGL
jgi:hypothetical protein